MMGISMHQTLIHLIFLGGSLVASYTTGDWSGCSATCQIGANPVYRYKISHCDNPNSGDCNAPEPETFVCNLPECPVDGAWGEWTVWSACSQTCGIGFRHQTRDCNYPVPSAGGRYCEGHHEKLEYCNEDPCPVSTDWTEWTDWTECEGCKHGAQSIRRRYCTPKAACTIPPQNDTKTCPYDMNICPVDGTWRLWGSWSECSVTCDKDPGTITRRRTCTEVQRKGKPCEGEEEQHKPCSGNTTCPVHCLWAEWASWEVQGMKELRNRERIGPFHGGRNCTGDSTDSRQHDTMEPGPRSGSGDGAKGDEDNSSGVDTNGDEDNANGNAGPMEGDEDNSNRERRDDEEGNPSGGGGE